MSEDRTTGTTAPQSLAVLFINRSDSRCGVCGKGAALGEKTHKTKLPGWGRDDGRSGCGVRWTHVSSDYAGDEDRIRELRPDLIWLDFFEALPHSDRAQAVAPKDGVSP